MQLILFELVLATYYNIDRPLVFMPAVCVQSFLGKFKTGLPVC